MSAMPPPSCCAPMPDNSRTAGMTLADCVPWLEIALDFIDRGPEGLSIEAVERYRTSLLEIIEHIRPAVEREALRTLVH